MSLLEKLKIRLPIIQAPMAGGIVTPKMIAEVCRCGGLGSLPLGYLTKEEARQAIKKTKFLTNGIFSVNVFIPASQIMLDSKKVTAMLEHINHYHRRLGLPEKKDISPFEETSAEELIDIAVNEENVTVVSFAFGTLNPKKISELQSKGVTVIGTATTVNEGKFLESIGCDAIVAQGYEAGGHRGGGFLEENAGGLVGTMVLIPQMVDAVNIPVIAAGGIMDGRGIIAAFVLGAQAVQMGTAFLTAKESATSELHKKMILNANENSTCLTTAYTGKSVRAFRNEYIKDTEKKFSSEDILAYPNQHQMTKEMRAQAKKIAECDYTGFWSGQGLRLSREGAIADMMDRFEEEMKTTISDLRDQNSRNRITFKSMHFSDIPLISKWFNTQHVQAFYSLRPWTEDEVLAKLTPYITGEQPVSGYMIVLDGEPIGYLQSYKVSDYPWPGQYLPEKITKSALGLDLFIGRNDLIGKGWGGRIVQTFIGTYVCPQYQYCIVDPDINNKSAIHCYEKLKFKEHKIIETVDSLQRPIKLKLMILKCVT